MNELTKYETRTIKILWELTTRITDLERKLNRLEIDLTMKQDKSLE